jgi:pimeloyl-ACP methyl ester carboxylesterase
MKQFYESAGARLCYLASGAGLPVVFLHPTPVDHDYWRPLVENLTGVRAILPDLRGHGDSELGRNLPAGGFAAVPDAPVLTMERYAWDILALLDMLAVRRAVFVGCSIGGYILLELWRQAPERVQGLAFLCSKPQPDAAANVEKRAATIAQARARECAAIFDGMTQTLIGATARKQRPEIVAELRARMTVSPEALVAIQAGLAARPNSVSTVLTISAPILAIAGGEDSGVTFAEMEVFRAAPGSCDLHLVPDAGHLAAYEQPQTVAALLAGWLQRFQG